MLKRLENQIINNITLYFNIIDIKKTRLQD